RVRPARQAAQGDAARRDPAVLERPQGRHEPRRPAADPPRLLRGARARASRVLAAARRAPRPHRARAGAPRLRDLDGGEARARSRMDRRPIRPSLSPHRLRHRLARAEAVPRRVHVARRLILLAVALGSLGVGLWLVLRPAHHPRLLVVGVDDDTLKWTPFPLTVVHRQESLGADAVSVWVPWHGEIAPTAEWQQRRFCGYAKHALALVPDARAVVVWNEANSPTYWDGTPAQYESLLARCYDVLHSRHVEVLDSTASAHSPIRFLDAVALAYRSSRRTRRLVDAFGHNPYPLTQTESPVAVHTGDFLGEGDYARLVTTLQAFGRTPSIWYLEDGFQTTKVSPARQAQDVSAAIDMAACQPF